MIIKAFFLEKKKHLFFPCSEHTELYHASQYNRYSVHSYGIDHITVNSTVIINVMRVWHHLLRAICPEINVLNKNIGNSQVMFIIIVLVENQWTPSAYDCQAEMYRFCPADIQAACTQSDSAYMHSLLTHIHRHIHAVLQGLYCFL